MSFPAIATRYCGASAHHPARVIATVHMDRTHSIQMPWDHALGVDANHSLAARKLAQHMGWHGSWIGGETARATVFCRIPDGGDRSDTAFCC